MTCVTGLVTFRILTVGEVSPCRVSCLSEAASAVLVPELSQR